MRREIVHTNWSEPETESSAIRRETLNALNARIIQGVLFFGD
jgi:hypothetical protein